MIPTRCTPELALKLAAIVTLTERWVSKPIQPLADAALLVDLLGDADVGAWLDSFDQLLLPIKRSPKEART